MNKILFIMTGRGEPWFDQQDEEIFSQLEILNGKYIPPPSEFLNHLESYINGQDVNLQWKCVGRRAPTPERKEPNELEKGNYLQEDSKANKEIDEGFEFEEETNQLNLSSVRRNATPQVSSKKTRPNSLQSILNDLERHRKIDMLETQDELENKMKQQDHLQESNSNQSESQNSNQNEDNSSQMLNLQNNEIGSNSNSQLEDQFHQNKRSFEENSQQQAEKSIPSENSELKQVQQEVTQLQIFREKLPQSSLNFQNILNKTLESNVESPSSSLPKLELLGKNTSNPSIAQGEQPSSTSTETISSESQQDHSIEFDAYGMNVKPMDFIGIKESPQGLEILGSDLPLPEESKQDLSEFDFQMDD